MRRRTRGHDTFTLRFPFRLEQTHPLLGVNEYPPTAYGGLEVLIRTDPLRTDPQSYVMQIAGFPNGEAAAQFLPRAWAGLTSLMLRYGAAYSTTFAPAEAMPSADAPVIYQADKVPIVYAGGTPSVTIPTPANLALPAITEGFDSPSAGERFADDPFRSAVELYSATLFEGSGAAQLVLLSSALEMLTPRPKKHAAALNLLEKWREEAATALAALPPDEDDPNNKDARIDLEALSNGLGDLKRRSIGRSIPRFVRAELSSDADADEMAQRAVDAYGKGSSIRHGGKVDACGNAIADLRTILKRIFVRRLSLTAT